LVWLALTGWLRGDEFPPVCFDGYDTETTQAASFDVSVEENSLKDGQ